MSEFLLKENRDKLQRMSNMIRYNNEVHIHNENVAEHSFYVAVYAMEICDILDLSIYYRRLVVEKALIHDIHEIELSDIPHNVKKNIEGFEERCIAFEKEFNKDYFADIIYRIEGDKYEQLIESIVELADVISVKQYAQQEVEFGNKKKFAPILDNSKVRIDDCLRKIKEDANGYQFKELEAMLGKD